MLVPEIIQVTEAITILIPILILIQIPETDFNSKFCKNNSDYNSATNSELHSGNDYNFYFGPDSDSNPGTNSELNFVADSDCNYRTDSHLNYPLILIQLSEPNSFSISKPIVILILEALLSQILEIISIS